MLEGIYNIQNGYSVSDTCERLGKQCYSSFLSKRETHQEEESCNFFKSIFPTPPKYIYSSIIFFES